MASNRFILPLFMGLSIWMTGPVAFAQDAQERCARMGLHQTSAEAIGYSLKRMKMDTIDIGDSIVVVEPRMAGLRGPNISLLGRDVRLAVTQWQTSPQELWHKGQWNKVRLDAPCDEPKLSWKSSLKRGLYTHLALDNQIGFTNYHPSILYRSRVVGEMLLVRPYGFTFGGSLGGVLATNTYALAGLPDPRPAVRRDMARYTYRIGFDRAYASWRATPITDVHVAVTAGYVEEMYAGAGAEVVWRPWNSPFWVGADGWSVWRRDANSFSNLQLMNDRDFTGHVRAGYDIPDTRYSVYAAAGKYLAGDVGATVGATRDFENGARINAAVTWTDREEYQGFFRNTQFDPMVHIVWPLGRPRQQGSRNIRTAFQQVGRDGGQMLDRPLPLEKMTEAFSTREVTRHWPELLERKTSDTKKEAAYVGGL